MSLRPLPGSRRLAGLCVLLAAIVPLAAECAAEDAPEPLAKQILDATGVRGGLVVHLGCGDGRLTAALRASDAYLVHGLDLDAENVATARRLVQSLGLDGRVTVSHWDGKSLPMIDNLVKLIVVDQAGQVSQTELLRALAPGGVAYLRTGQTWTKMVKPWSQEIDQWTHFLHDASGNAVAKDSLVGPPKHMQWTADPTWTRNHHKLASISSVVTSDGRIFYIVDEGPASSMQIPATWYIAARDAFSGVLLWKRSISNWSHHNNRFRSGPVQLPRTLVAQGDRVYLPLGITAPLSALDAATGEVLATYQATEGTEEVLLDDGILLVVTGSPVSEQALVVPQWAPVARFPNEKTILAIRADTGEILWKRIQPATARLMPLTLAARAGRVVFQAGRGVVALDLQTGKQLWQTVAGTAAAETARPRISGQKPTGFRDTQRSVGWSVNTLVLYRDLVLWADGRNLRGMSADDGEMLWQAPCNLGFQSPTDVLVAGGLVWTGPEFAQGRDPRTGEVKKTNTVTRDYWTAGHHHRCYREKATERFILTGKRGIEFVDLEGDRHARHNWVRGVCQYGIMPANGLIYAPTHSCGCFMETKLYGFWALAGERRAKLSGDVDAEDRLQRGPAHGSPAADLSLAVSRDWPTHRGDASRSGSTAAEIPAQLNDRWQTDLGGRLTAPVVSGDTVIVASVDTHRVIALDAADGKQRWTFTAGGRVDSPPTIHKSLVLFGSADGWVYCLRQSDGELVWRFRAAAADMMTVALGQVESLWPVHGSVLVQNGVAYFVAGRSSYLDGGLFLHGLDPASGKVISSGRLESEQMVGPAALGETDSDIEPVEIVQNMTDSKTFTAADSSDAFSMEGSTSDILVGDGDSVYLRHLCFDRDLERRKDFGRHLFSTSRLLDGAENHRSHFVLGSGDFSRVSVAYSWIANARRTRFEYRLEVPYGLLLAFDNETVWGVARKYDGYALFAQPNQLPPADAPHQGDFRPAKEDAPSPWAWSAALAMRPRAMVRAGGRLVLAGMPALPDDPASIAPDELIALNAGRRGGTLQVFSTADGTKLSQRELDSPPVFDGLAVAAGQVYMATHDGQVVCLGGE